MVTWSKWMQRYVCAKRFQLPSGRFGGLRHFLRGDLRVYEIISSHASERRHSCIDIAGLRVSFVDAVG